MWVVVDIVVFGDWLMVVYEWVVFFYVVGVVGVVGVVFD